MLSGTGNVAFFSSALDWYSYNFISNQIMNYNFKITQKSFSEIIIAGKI
jgi:hypothetical protein